MGRLLQHQGRAGCAKYKNFILPPVFTKRLSDVFHDELERIAEDVGSSARALKLVTRDQNHVRFHLPVQTENPDAVVWSVVRKLSDKIGEQLTTHLPAIAKANPLHQGIIDRIDFNATTGIWLSYGVTRNTVCRNIFNWKQEEIGRLERKVKTFCDRQHVLEAQRVIDDI